jgi:tRNA modification GTPase
MNLASKLEDTICGIATAPGNGGVAIIRVSGSKALEVCKLVVKNFPQNFSYRTSYFFHFIDPKNQEIIDEGLFIVFENKNSFTGELVVELQVHGNSVLNQNQLQILTSCGARLSERGEFTFRAFYNGKTTLAQAEALNSFILSSNSNYTKYAYKILKGDLSRVITNLEKDLLGLLALTEASIDFSTEDIQILSKDAFNEKLKNILLNIEKLNLTYESGHNLNKSQSVCLFGAANTGKSSLMNLISSEEISIVSDLAGTTRDSVKNEIIISNIKVEIIDTAGVRSTSNDIESQGIEISKKRAIKSDLVIFVIDLSADISSQMGLFLTEQKKFVNWIFVLNKIDLVKNFSIENFCLKYKIPKDKVIAGSALSQDFSLELKQAIFSVFKDRQMGSELILIHQRHAEELKSAYSELKTCELLDGFDLEILSIHLREALYCLQRIIGKQYDDDLLDRIFKEFCLGK